MTQAEYDTVYDEATRTAKVTNVLTKTTLAGRSACTMPFSRNSYVGL